MGGDPDAVGVRFFDDGGVDPRAYFHDLVVPELAVVAVDPHLDHVGVVRVRGRGLMRCRRLRGWRAGKCGEAGGLGGMASSTPKP